MSGSNADDNWAYVYDSLDRLTSSTNTVSGTTQYFTWSPNGRLLNKSNFGAYVYPAQGAANGRPHAPTSVAGYELRWDANGNLHEAFEPTRTRLITWDAENRPARPLALRRRAA